ncbi:hypothetical protein [Blastococcus sp. SYSU D01042]
MWAPISTNQSGSTRTAPGSRAAAFAGLLVALAAAGLGTAAPAAAIDDPTRPDATVTHGPSCRPGGLVVEVVAGTLPYSVRLATTREPDGEDEALLQPHGTVVLSTGDVAPGETIDGRLEYAAQDGSGSTYVDELDDWTFTRPTLEDCDQATAPPEPPAPEPPATEPPATPPLGQAPPPDDPTGTPGPAPEPPSDPAPTVPAPTAPAPPAPGPGAPVPAEPRPTGPAPADRPTTPAPSAAPAPEPQAGAAPAAVAAGGVVRVRVEGYQPGEQVSIALHGTDEVLAEATADDDGAVVAEVLIPAWTASGPASLDVVGEGAAAVVPLEVASATDGAPADRTARLPLLLAAGALTATATGLVTTAARRRAARR